LAARFGVKGLRSDGVQVHGRFSRRPFGMALRIAMLLFPGLTQLDLTGPYEIFWRLPDAPGELCGAQAVPGERIAVDRNRITGGGVTAGIDFALRVAAELCGEDVARGIQLQIEYNPAPPFHAGSPATAGPTLTALARQRVAALHEKRRRALRRTPIN